VRPADSASQNMPNTCRLSPKRYISQRFQQGLFHFGFCRGKSTQAAPRASRQHGTLERYRKRQKFPTSHTKMQAIPLSANFNICPSAAAPACCFSRSTQTRCSPTRSTHVDLQGITDDGRYYVAARLAITHPSLPRGIDFTDNIVRDLSNYNYVKKKEKELDRFSEDSFWPSLKILKTLLSCIHVE
jgi:hypothetical protein